MNELWIWLAVGVLPYYNRHQYTLDGTRILTVRALFWSLHIERQRSNHYDWTVHLPLIERLRDAAWDAMLRLRGAGPQENQ